MRLTLYKDERCISREERKGGEERGGREREDRRRRGLQEAEEQ